MDKYLLKEKIIHGHDDFPVGIYHTDIGNGTDNILYLHWHEEFEFLTVTKGRAVFRLADMEIEVGKGESIFVNANVLHAAHAINGEECSFSAVVFHQTFLSSYSNDCINQNYINPILNHSLTFSAHFKMNIHWQKEVLILLTQIFNTNEEKEPGYELLLKSKIYEIWFKCIQNATKAAGNNPDTSYKTERMKLVLQFIHDNYSKKINVSELANIIHMSKEHFCRFFKEMTHYTPVSYVNRYRIQKSCILLLQTDKKISEIAGIVGFEGISYFNKIFRRIMRCTPVEYRSPVKN